MNTTPIKNRQYMSQETFASCIANCNNNPKYNPILNCKTMSANPFHESFNENFKGASCIVNTIASKNKCIFECNDKFLTKK